MWTVWEFRSVDGKQVVRSLRRSEPMDQKYQHEYQRIVYRGDDYAMAKASL
jgi:hypothetical protein